MSKKEYTIQNRTQMLKERKKRCCCKFCGGELSLKRIIFNQFEEAKVELYCTHCDRIEFGVEPEIYRSAEKFVDQLEVNFYGDMDENELNRQMNIARVCEIMAWGYKDLGIVNRDGFTIELDTDSRNWSECLVVYDEDLEKRLGVTENGNATD